MSLWSEFKNELKNFGLERFGRFYSFYRGSVYDNEDPEYLGRLRVVVPQIYGEDFSPNYWAYPRGIMQGSFVIPKPGDTIYVTFEMGDTRYPCWEHGWYTTGKTPENAQRSKPDNYMFQTPGGLRVEMDDAAEKITLTNKDGFIIDLTPQGISIKKGSKDLKTSLDDMNAKIKLIQVPTPLGLSGTPANALDFDQIVQDIAGFLV